MPTKKEIADLKAGKLSPADARRVKRELAAQRQGKAQSRATKKPLHEEAKPDPWEQRLIAARQEMEDELTARWQEAERSGDQEALKAIQKERYALIEERSHVDLDLEAKDRRRARRLERIAAMKAFLDARDRGHRKMTRRTGIAHPPPEQYHPDPTSAAALGLE